jgi:cytochrome P450
VHNMQDAPVRKVLFTDDFVQNPYPAYRRLLDEGPLHYLDVGGMWAVWAVFGHAECSAVAKDPRLSAKRAERFVITLPMNKRAEFADLVRMLGLWMIFMDPPEHSRLRKLMNKGFSREAIETLRPQIEGIVDRMLEPLQHCSEVELMREFAYTMPVRVISEMLGVPETMHESFLRWSAAIAAFNGSANRTIEQAEAAQKAVHALTDFFRGAMAERRRRKTDDFLSFLLAIEEEGEVLTEEELHAQCVMMLFAGHETTRNLIGNGIYALLQHPERMHELHDDPGLIRTAVEELLRYESPIQYTARVVKEEMEICGRRIPQRQTILCMLGAANRDAKQFKEPDRLDLKRLNNQHLAFSAGPHFCIGSQLARLEGQIAILQLVRRFPQMRLAVQQPEWSPNVGFRGLKTLPVTL